MLYNIKKLFDKKILYNMKKSSLNINLKIDILIIVLILI